MTLAALTGPSLPAPHVDDQIDWRFLLGGDALGRVALAGPVEPAVREALAAHADVIADLGEPSAAPHDLVVLVDPDLATVRRAVDDLAPTGTIRIEQLARRRRSAVQRHLRGADLEVFAWWHRPSSTDSNCLIALDRPIAAATVVRLVAGRGRRTPVEARLVRWSHVDRWAVAVSFLAARRGAPHPPIASPNGEPIAALITPRFAASRAVIGVTTITGGRHLGQVAKVARHPSDDAMIVHEAELLDRFASVAGPVPAAPATHRLVIAGGRIVLVEDAAQGSPLDRRAVRRAPGAALAAGVEWLERVPVAPPTSVRVDGRAHALLTGPLRSLAARPAPDPMERDDLVGRATEALEPLMDATLPGPFEHGDFSHPNLFRQPGGELVAIDWELAEPLGLPLHDLLFFVSYLAESVDRPRDPVALVAAHRRALGGDGWAQSAVTRYLKGCGVDPALRPQLALACWTRYLAGRSASLAPAGIPAHRYETLWRAAISDAEAVR